MRPFLETVFGRKKPTSAAVQSELAKVEAELAAVPARVAAAEAALKHIADMTDDEHAEAEARLAAERRAPSRLAARTEQLRAALADAERTEAAAARRAEAEAARKAMADMRRLLDRFDEQARALADTAAEIAAIDAAVESVNRVIVAARRAGLDAPELVKTSCELFRTEPDKVEPDRVVVDETWKTRDENGRLVSLMVLDEDSNGKMRPRVADAELHRKERTIPGRTRPGRRYANPLMSLCLPATRLGGKAAWPKVM